MKDLYPNSGFCLNSTASLTKPFFSVKLQKVSNGLLLPYRIFVYCFLSLLLLFGGYQMGQAQTPLADINTFPLAFNDTLEVCSGQLIQFFNESENTEDTYQWNFGDINSGFFNTSIDTIATYTYNNGDTYLVTLTNVCDEADSDSLIVLVSDSFTPQIDCIGTQCPNDAVTYTTNAPCGMIDWFVEGAITWTIHEGDSITVVWGNQSEGTIELYVSDCVDSYCTTPLIETIPIVSDTADIMGELVVCQNQIETYTLPWLQATFFNWSFAAGSQGIILEGQGSNQIKVRWNTVGEQVLQCHYSSSFLGCEGFAETLVDVRPRYSISSFSTPFCVNEIIPVTASHNAAFDWTLSGGTLVSGQGTDEIEVVFDMAGIYTITAIPVDTTAFCNDPALVSTTITIVDVPPAPNPIEGQTFVCPQQPYLYDLEPLSDTLVVHWAALNGTVSNSVGLPVVVTWDNEPPYALYAWHETLHAPYCASDTVVLDIMTIDGLVLTGDASICAGHSGAYAVTPDLPEFFYEWTIDPPNAGAIGEGQGTANILVNWNIIPQDATVSVSSCGFSADLAMVVLPNPVPQATATPENLCPGDFAELVGEPGYAAYQWINENGAIIATSSSTMVNSGGAYTLVVTDEEGCQGNVSVFVNETALPEAVLSPEENYEAIVNNELGDTVFIHNLFSPDYTYTWFLNGEMIDYNEASYPHIITEEDGTFLYQSQVYNQFDCTETSNTILITQVSYILPPLDSLIGGGGGGSGENPTPVTSICVVNASLFLDFTFETCADGNSTRVRFTNISETAVDSLTSQYWDFGDGSPLVPTFVGDVATHEYTEAQWYRAKLVTRFPNIILNSTVDSCDLVTKKQVPVGMRAIADYAPACEGGPIQFFDLSASADSGYIQQWTWDFGDGSPLIIGSDSAARFPMHTYDQNGMYDFTLTLTNLDENCTSSTTNTVFVFANPVPVIAAPDTICINQSFDLSNVGTGTDEVLTWEWNFGDGVESQLPNPNYSYDSVGTYTIHLAVTNNANCMASTSHDITVVALDNPFVTVSDSIICTGDTSFLQAPTGVSYLWNTGDTTAILPVTETGTYQVHVTNQYGCVFTLPFVEVLARPQPIATLLPSGTVELCEGETLQAQLLPNEGVVYEWNVEENVFGNSILITESGEYHFQAIDELSGCVAFSDTLTVIYHPAPETPDMTINGAPYSNIFEVCVGTPVTLSATHPTLNDFVWSTGETTDTIEVEGGYYTVRVINEMGCMALKDVFIQYVSLPNVSGFPTGCFDHCEGEPIVLAYTEPDVQYDWYVGDSLIAQNTTSIMPQESGDYYMVATNAFCDAVTTNILSLEVASCACMMTANYQTICSEDSTYILFGTIQNGTPPYVFNDSISNFVLEDTFLLAGLPLPNALDFNITITDANDCSFEFSACCEGCSLPISLLSFTGKALEKNNQLNWVTASEYNNHHFVLEKSGDGQRFETVGHIPSKGNSNQNQGYVTYDDQPYTPVTYYRLAQVDVDGTRTQHQIISVLRSDAPTWTIDHLYFDAQRNQLQAEVTSTGELTIAIEIIDLLGRKLKSFDLETEQGNQILTVNTGNWSNGVYILQLTDGKQISAQKWVK